jgi:uncharacterized membrane protein
MSQECLEYTCDDTRDFPCHLNRCSTHYHENILCAVITCELPKHIPLIVGLASGIIFLALILVGGIFIYIRSRRNTSGIATTTATLSVGGTSIPNSGNGENQRNAEIENRSATDSSDSEDETLNYENRLQYHPTSDEPETFESFRQSIRNTESEDEEINSRWAAANKTDRAKIAAEIEAERKERLERQLLRLSTESFSLTFTMSRFEKGDEKVPITCMHLTREIPGVKPSDLESREDTFRHWLSHDLELTESELRNLNDPLPIKMRKLMYFRHYGMNKKPRESSQLSSV